MDNIFFQIMVSCLSCSRYTTKTRMALFMLQKLHPLNSFHSIHLLVQRCTVIHVYFDHLCGLQTSENAPGKFDTRTKVVCTFMCKNMHRYRLCVELCIDFMRGALSRR